MQPLPPKHQQKFEELINEQCWSGCRIGSWLIIVIFSAFYFVDRHVVMPQYLPLFTGMRVLVCLIHGVLLLEYQKKRFSPQKVALFGSLSVGVPIVVMILFTGGPQSAYYAGLCLVMIGASVAVTWKIHYQLILNSVLYFSYLFLNLAFHEIENMGYFVSNNGFLLGNYLLSLAAARGNYVFRLKNFTASLDIENAYHQLRILDRAKSGFLANLSHELKTPLMLVLNPLEQFLENNDYRQILLNRQTIRRIRRNLYRLSTLISDLIELTRKDVGKSYLCPEEIVNTRRYFEELFNLMRPFFMQKELKTVFRVMAKSGPATLRPHYFDKKKMDKVINNLLSNAIKFTPRGGTVELILEDVTLFSKDKNEPALRIIVRDSGIGMAKDKLPFIFDRFMQGEEGASRTYEGMGLGLSMVKDYIEEHGGQMTVESEVNQGTIFTLTIPRGSAYFRAPVLKARVNDIMLDHDLNFTRELLENENEVDPPLTVDPISEPLKKENSRPLMIVDDNSDVRAAIRQVLAPYYPVLEAANGEEAIRQAREQKPALILLDLMMPTIDGLTTTKLLKKDVYLKNIPVILLTAKSGEDTMEAAFRVGANDFLTKPFSHRELLLRVQNLLSMEAMKANLVQQENLALVGTLSAGISHNMNTYAVTIDCGLDLLKARLEKTPLSDQEKRILLSAVSSSEQGLRSIQHMIHSLEQYSQKNREGFQECDFIENLNSVVLLAKTRLPAEITLLFRAQPVGTVWFNPHVFNPAVMNLINNAVDACHGKEKGLIEMEVRIDGEHVLLEISDNGSGILHKNRNRVWEAYFTTKEVDKGTGLGLWMVRKAIEEEHGGEVWFANREEGTSFYIRLPRRGKNSEKEGLLPGNSSGTKKSLVG